MKAILFILIIFINIFENIATAGEDGDETSQRNVQKSPNKKENKNTGINPAAMQKQKHHFHPMADEYVNQGNAQSAPLKTIQQELKAMTVNRYLQARKQRQQQQQLLGQHSTAVAGIIGQGSASLVTGMNAAAPVNNIQGIAHQLNKLHIHNNSQPTENANSFQSLLQQQEQWLGEQIAARYGQGSSSSSLSAAGEIHGHQHQFQGQQQMPQFITAEEEPNRKILPSRLAANLVDPNQTDEENDDDDANDGCRKKKGLKRKN